MPFGMLGGVFYCISYVLSSVVLHKPYNGSTHYCAAVVLQ